MTTWQIEYGDEAGNQNTRTTDDIEEVHATLEVIVKDDERTAGYAGQTATWHGYEARDENGYGPGNWTLSVTNLDTHDRDGYEREAEEVHTTDLADVRTRLDVLDSVITSVCDAHRNPRNVLWVQNDPEFPGVVTVVKTQGYFGQTLRRWRYSLNANNSNVTVWDSATWDTETLDIENALAYILLQATRRN